ncbi:MAG: AAA family ATPase [Pseudomonadota bacterium]
MSVRRVLITGCSSGGKSTLVAELARRGQEIVREPGRRVVRAERRMGGTGLPWIDAERFGRLCLRIATADWEGVRAGTAFFDRGVFDAAVNLGRMGFEAEATRYLNQFPYDTTVILAPPWEALFAEDAERQNNFEDAVEEYVALAGALSQLGYTAHVLPEASVSDRADAVEAWVAAQPVLGAAR